MLQVSGIVSLVVFRNVPGISRKLKQLLVI